MTSLHKLSTSSRAEKKKPPRRQGRQEKKRNFLGLGALGVLAVSSLSLSPLVLVQVVQALRMQAAAGVAEADGAGSAMNVWHVRQHVAAPRAEHLPIASEMALDALELGVKEGRDDIGAHGKLEAVAAGAKLRGDVRA